MAEPLTKSDQIKLRITEFIYDAMAFAELNPDTVAVEGLPTIDRMVKAEPNVITLVLNDGTEAGRTFSVVIMDGD